MEAKAALNIVGEFMKIAPVDVRGLANALGLRVEDRPLADNVSGRIRKSYGNRYVITVNMYHSFTRQRFTIAHEIAHFVLHRDLIGDGIEDDGLYRSKLSNPIERQANSYAADILMPWPLVILRYQQGLEMPEQFAHEFQVSIAVAEIRLREMRARVSIPFP